MNRFTQCLDFVLAREGGYGTNPKDRGGSTNKGVTQKTYSTWRMSRGMSALPVMNISDNEVYEIYESQYWGKVRADSLPQPLDLCVFDAAVQHGTGTAAKWLQRIVGVQQDGAIGPKTLLAVTQTVDRDGVASMVEYYMTLRDDFYHAIVENDASQVIFLRGWMNRMQHLRGALEAQ